MTDRFRLRIEASAIALIFGAGSGYATYQARLSALEAKIDTKFEQLQSELKPLKDQVGHIDRRVSSMYCAQVPPANRAGCE